MLAGLGILYIDILLSLLVCCRRREEGDGSEDYSGSWFKCYRRRCCPCFVNPCGSSFWLWHLIVTVLRRRQWWRLWFSRLFLARSHPNQKDFSSRCSLADGPIGGWRRSTSCQRPTTHRLYQLRKYCIQFFLLLLFRILLATDLIGSYSYS